MARVLGLMLAAALWSHGGDAVGQPSVTRPFEVVEATIDDVSQALRSKRVTCRALVQAYVQRIDAYDKAGPALNAIQTVNPAALTEAERLDAAFAASGPVGPLHCVPVLVKDQVETKDLPTSYGSIVFKGFMTGRDATVVDRLRKAGAVIVAKTTMGEFASGYLGSAFGAVRNAYDPTRMASGSSGGTGSGVAASFGTVGIAEDTGGSTRGPAAVNNLVGLRPTVPLVSRFGMLPARPTTDTLGPIGRTVRDVALVLDVIAGHDHNDPVTAESVGHVPPSYTTALRADGLKGKRLGVLRTPLDPRADATTADYARVRAVVDGAIADLRRLGAEVVDAVPPPDLARRSASIYDDNVYETEAALNAYLAQFPSAPAKTLAEVLLTGKVAPARARAMASLLGHATADPGYGGILVAREALRRDVFAMMADQKFDALVYATFDNSPPVIPPDALTRTTIDATGSGNNRRLSPALGFPAITVPAGFTADGLPVGVELLGRPFDEPMLFTLAYAYEQGTHHRRPPNTTPPLVSRGSAALPQPRSQLALMLESEVSRMPARVGLYVKHLKTGEDVAIRADEIFSSQSTRKIPIMVMAFQAVERGALSLEQRVPVQRSDFRNGTGVLQYHDPGASLTIRDLITEMIITSDNTATSMVIARLGGPDRINQWLAENDYVTRTKWGSIDGTRKLFASLGPPLQRLTDEEVTALEYLRTDNPLFASYADLFAGARQALPAAVVKHTAALAESIRHRRDDDEDYWTGRTTPREIGGFLEAIERGTAVSAKWSLAMKHILLRQQLGVRRLPHYLAVPVAHKTGDGPAVANDVGIVYARSGPIVVSFFATSIAGPYGETEDHIGRIARLIVDYFDGTEGK